MVSRREADAVEGAEGRNEGADKPNALRNKAGVEERGMSTQGHSEELERPDASTSERAERGTRMNKPPARTLAAPASQGRPEVGGRTRIDQGVRRGTRARWKRQGTRTSHQESEHFVVSKKVGN